MALAATVRTATGGLNRGIGDGPLPACASWSSSRCSWCSIWIGVAFGKRRDPGFGVLSRAGTATVTLITVVTLVSSFALGLFGRTAAAEQVADRRPRADLDQLSPVKGTPGVTGAARPGDNSAALPLGLLFGAIAVLVVAFAFLALIRAIRKPRLPGGVTVAPFTPLDEAEELAEAVEAGSQALEEEGDAREAVIACYAAMEQAVQGFGFARPLADTPEDMLRRATEKNLVPPGPAARLTELFREARFSRHAITETLRDEARTALAEIGAYIRDLQERQNAEKPPPRWGPRRGPGPRTPTTPTRSRNGPTDERPGTRQNRKPWLAVGAAQAAMTVVVGTATYLALGAKWLGAGLGLCLGGIALAAWYTLSGRTLGNQPEVRERMLERPYVGVAWYASMLRTAQEHGGYERGLRVELTRLCAARPGRAPRGEPVPGPGDRARAGRAGPVAAGGPGGAPAARAEAAPGPDARGGRAHRASGTDVTLPNDPRPPPPHLTTRARPRAPEPRTPAARPRPEPEETGCPSSCPPARPPSARPASSTRSRRPSSASEPRWSW